MRILLHVVLLSLFLISNNLQAQFSPGNLAVFRADVASANNTSFNIIELNASTAGQASPVNIFAINGAGGSDALRTSGSASSTGYLSNSNDGSLVCFTGHNSTLTTGNANTITSRGAGTLNAAGNFSLATVYTGTSGNQTRSATTINNSTWFIADQGGVYSNNTSAASPAGNFRSIKAFGGAVYIFQASAAAAPVSTVSTAISGTITGLPGLANGTSSYQDFYMISSGNNGASFDVLYTLAAASAVSGTIAKYSLVAGNWVANGSYSTSFGGFGLAAANTGTGTALYVTTGLGATTANSVVKMMDDGGYNTAISVTLPIVTLYTTSAATTLKGIAFAPVAVVTPSVIANPATVNFGNILSGATSAGQNISLTASNLIPSTGTLTVTSPGVDFEVFDGNTWGSMAMVNYSAGGSTIDNIQLRFSPHTTGALTGNISITGGGLASAVVISASGTGDNNLSFTFSSVTTAALNPPYISGTVNDPLDPASTTGFVVAVKAAGVDLPMNSYVIDAAINNTTVVPAGNLEVTRSDGSAVLKITPAATGYADITLTLRYGTDSKDLVVHYAASTAASSAASWPTGFADASAAIPIDDNYMVIGNDESNQLYVLNRNASGLPVKIFDFNAGNLLGLTDGTPGNWKEADVEAATSSPITAGKTYWLGSMSNSSSFNDKPNRNRLFAINMTGTGAAADFTNAGYYAGLRQQLISWGDANGYNFSASAADGKDSKTIDGFNAEGMVFGPDNTTLYIAFRAPLVPLANRTKAVIAPIQNFETWFNNGAPSGNPVLGTPIELDLGGRGIRDIIRLSNGNYVIVAGSYNGTLVPAIYRWTGNAVDAPLVLPSFDLTGLNAEAVIGVNDGGVLATDKLQIICDDGDNAFYNDGVAAKDLVQANYKKFSSQIVLSPTAVLPVNFEYFTAQRKDANVLLNWKTGVTDNGASFDIMRSGDGASFSKLQAVSAGSNQSNYSFTDVAAPVDKLYYRIQAKDISGKTFVSSTHIVEAGGLLAQSVRIYPNPVSNGVFSITINKPGTKNVQVYNSAGIIYRHIIFSNNSTRVSTQGWAGGYYLLRITYNDGTMSTEKIIVQ